jgi:UDP-glucuronate decarboxylase
LVEGIYKVLTLNQMPFSPINLGNPNEFTMLELAKTVISATGSSSQIVFHPLPEDDPKQRRPDISLASKVLQWEPGIQLEDGINRTIDYFRKQLI